MVELGAGMGRDLCWISSGHQAYPVPTKTHIIVVIGNTKPLCVDVQIDEQLGLVIVSLAEIDEEGALRRPSGVHRLGPAPRRLSQTRTLAIVNAAALAAAKTRPHAIVRRPRLRQTRAQVVDRHAGKALQHMNALMREWLVRMDCAQTPGR